MQEAAFFVLWREKAARLSVNLRALERAFKV